MRQSCQLFALASIAMLQGCSTHSTWKQVPISQGVAPAVSPFVPVRVTRVDGSVIVLEHPRIAGDSLIGDVGNPPERFALLLRDALRIEARSESVDKLRIGGNVLKGTAVVVGVVAVAMLWWLLSNFE